MIQVRKSAERGHLNFGWLDTYHTFSFGEYHDPGFMGFRSLRVINEDKVQPGKGFGTHPHSNMEIITYVIQGELAHKDSMGNGSTIYPGEVQYMSAGTGVTHSEFNHSREQSVHLLQIWILPDQKDGEPRYGQKMISTAQKKNRLYRIVGQDGSGAPIEIHQDAVLFATILDAGKSVVHELAPKRGAWIQIVRGKANVQGQLLSKGDGAALVDESLIQIEAHEETELLLFDLN